MKQAITKIILQTTAIGIAAFVANILLYTIMIMPLNHFHYPLYTVYLFFLVLAVAVQVILANVNEKNPGQTGYVFLFLTTAQLVAAYFFAKPLLAKTIAESPEKINFFVVFLLFLAIEAYYTIRLLNKQ